MDPEDIHMPVSSIVPDELLDEGLPLPDKHDDIRLLRAVDCAPTDSIVIVRTEVDAQIARRYADECWKPLRIRVDSNQKQAVSITME